MPLILWSNNNSEQKSYNGLVCGMWSQVLEGGKGGIRKLYRCGLKIVRLSVDT
jgi:hypothetical protein